jgi:hypothetical protein
MVNTDRMEMYCSSPTHKQIVIEFSSQTIQQNMLQQRTQDYSIWIHWKAIEIFAVSFARNRTDAVDELTTMSDTIQPLQDLSIVDEEERQLHGKYRLCTQIV